MENINENINGKQLRARFALGRLNINYHIINHYFFHSLIISLICSLMAISLNWVYKASFVDNQ